VTTREKLQKLKDDLGKMGSAAIAFSGGVDSTFLAKMAREVLGQGALAFTAVSSSFPAREKAESRALAKQIGIRQVFFTSEEVDIPQFQNNPPDRCYYCKKELFSKLIQKARKAGIETVLDGSNADDTGDFRPGLKALEEMHIVSPLKEAGLTKAEIRILSKSMGLPTWDKPAFACLSSRFQYGDTITVKKLSRVEKAEDFLKTEGFKVLRIRDHGAMVRIETAQEEMDRFVDPDFRNRVVDKLKSLGYTFVSLDLEGYRTGSMNEALKKKS
jgi:uncharacterized protein